VVDEVEFRRVPVPPLPVLEREWRALEAVSTASFFTSWQWIGTLLGTVPTTRRPSLLRGVARGETIALAVLGCAVTRRRLGLIRSRTLHLNEVGNPRFDALTIEHNGILAAAGREFEVYEATLAWFAGLSDEADELYLSGSARRLPETIVEDRGLGRREISLPSFSVDLGLLAPGDGELYPVLSANARQQLRRAFRNFERHGPLHLSAAATPAEALQFFGALKALHCASWERRGKLHAFTGPFFEPFHRRLIESCFDEDGLQLLRASAGDRVIGYLYNFRLGSRIYAYQSGFAEAGRGERPGVVTHALAIRRAFRSGARVYDFMAGHNRLKQSLATRCERMLWQVFQQPRLAFRLERLARRVKRGLVARKPLSLGAQHDRASACSSPN
jgi:CelD/BcsL family acetyltransferase involved in cellulose biosynthesis